MSLPHNVIPTGYAATLAGQADAQDAERMSRYRMYLDFYDGQQWERRRRAGEKRLVVNYARALLRKGVSYLFAGDTGHNVLTDKGEQPTPEQAQAVEGLLSSMYADNDLITLDWQAGLDAAVVGDLAQKVTWSKRLNRPVVTNVDPQGLWVWWMADNPREVYRVLQKFAVSQEEAHMIYGVELMGDLPAERTRTVVVVEEWRADRFSVEVGGQLVVDGAANPYGWIPYIVAPNTARPHEFWGASDLEDLFDVCREINSRLTAVSAVLDLSGYPITVLEGVDKADGIRATAGAIWELPEDSKAYLLDLLQGGGMTLHIDFINTLYRALHDLSETPRTAFGDSGRTLSGVALEVEIQPLVQKVIRKRRIWDRVYRQRNAMLLDLAERFGGAETFGLRRTAPAWGDILPSDRTALVTAEAQLVAGNIHSRKKAAANLGVEDPDALFAEVLAEMAELGALAAAHDRQEGTEDGDGDDDQGESQDAA